MKNNIVRKIVRFFSPRIIILFSITMVLGILLGIAEMAVGLAFQNFLKSYGLISSKGIPEFLAPVLSMPLLSLIVIIIVRSLIHFFAGLMPKFSYEAFRARFRKLVAANTIGVDFESRAISSLDVSHILSNLIPKTGDFVYAVCLILEAGVLLVTLLVSMLLLSVKLTLFTFIPVIVLGLPILLLKKKYQKYAQDVYICTRDFTFGALKALRNIYFLRIVGTNKREVKRLLRLNQRIFIQFLKYVVATTATHAWPLFGGMIIIIFVVLTNYRGGYVESGVLVTFGYLLLRVAPGISHLATGIGQLNFGYPFLREFLEYMQPIISNKQVQGLEKRGGFSGVPAELKLQDLTVGRDRVFVDNINLTLKKGDFLLVSGKSGRGKTTFLMTILGIIPKLSGRVLWNDVDLEEWDQAVFRQHVGYSGTDPFLVDGTVEENLFYGLHNKEYAVANLEKIIELAGCSFIYGLDGGLKYKLAEEGEGISAGQKQRISLARSLLYNPGILILDEATANIDEPTEEKILSSIRSEYPDLTIIAVSHRASLKKFCSRYLTL